VKELKRFLKITLNPGETKKIQLKISQEDLSYWDNELRFRVDPGKFKLFIGGSSEAVIEADFEVKSIKK
jgi:beta-glucosidase